MYTQEIYENRSLCDTLLSTLLSTKTVYIFLFMKYEIYLSDIMIFSLKYLTLKITTFVFKNLKELKKKLFSEMHVYKQVF